jgi:hypothetical protein
MDATLSTHIHVGTVLLVVRWRPLCEANGGKRLGYETTQEAYVQSIAGSRIYTKDAAVSNHPTAPPWRAGASTYFTHPWISLLSVSSLDAWLKHLGGSRLKYASKCDI